MNKLSLLAAVAAAVLLAACGGSGSDAEPAPIEDPNLVPASATASTSAWFNFTSALKASDSAEALMLSAISELPTSESEEPLPLPQ